ncbi:tRNA (guanine-N(7)-)-methyltransferase [Bifidobacterium mongoliense DSM 21395]|jgi:tRNA (guanine-N7-)-methyltransferase|uniref:tRNA (guanine-N(7)-)-methyltransferase n=4 Tax=Bifidobacterium mongoliense TaxID=518643 RepID=A0A087BWV3_9BIFI|nr:tRNA (guanine-N(7)-)-methyltransferase [Bifidobacterium mongoliense DSM 21395]ROT87098.1 tRNA (guanine-N7)-methyltransferase [Bifidobacterium mongoliense]
MRNDQLPHLPPTDPAGEIPDAAHDAADNAAHDAAGEGGHGMSGARRVVLSFVRRRERLDERLERAKETYQDRYMLPIDAGGARLGVRLGVRFDRALVERAWGNDHPLIVEVGTGQGENIVAAAAARPDMNFLALEVYDPGIAHTLLLAGKQGLDNLRIAQVNAPALFEVAESGLAAEVWTFFPDPWPKMRHHKRRIVQPAFADAIRRVLVPGGVWRIATDIEDYALHVHEVMDGRADMRNAGSVTVSLPTEHVGKGTAGMAQAMPHADFLESERFDGRILTNFERKGIAAGRRIHDFTYQAV